MNLALEAFRRPRLVSGGVVLGEHRVTEANTATGRVRLNSIDLLRGLIMIVMALDHTRDFFAPGGFNPRDVTQPALFLTRWITHFCAPVFIFLAGISAFLYGTKHTTRGVSRFLFTRGCWLILIEFTLVRVGWTFSLSFDHLVIQVIFVIGAAMIALAALVHLPRWAIAAIGLAMIVGHNMFDGVKGEQLGAAAPIWNLLHHPALLDLGFGLKVFVLYPVIPWIGVMAAGYALGPLLTLERVQRVQRLFLLGASITTAFVLVRATNLYGDPAPWSFQTNAIATMLSYISCEKYPPSLLYLAMTLGPALMLLAAFDGVNGKLAGWITAFGRVPFFYYVVHIYLIHALALLFSWVTIGSIAWMFASSPPQKPANYGLDLPGIYAVWLAVVILLYPVCRWFADIKRHRAEWWWSYL
ncbi:MAG: heparan-alpha-glucosaminide N-acetyltransferase domain-containing protein [Pseudolabrys sp.]